MPPKRKDSQLLMVESQIVKLIPNPSFSHNLCLKCPNGSCEPTLNIYVPRNFQWYKERLNPMGFDPYNHFLKIWSCISYLMFLFFIFIFGFLSRSNWQRVASWKYRNLLWVGWKKNIYMWLCKNTCRHLYHT